MTRLGLALGLAAALVGNPLRSFAQSTAGAPPAAPARPAADPQNGRELYPFVYNATTPDGTEGFSRIFDGTTLTGWDGDRTFWRVENGSIVGESTPAATVNENTFLVWRGGTLRDFELKLDFRIHGENSGVQYRSVELPDVGKWVLKGYQADMDLRNFFTGNIHDERGRNVLAEHGQMVRAVDARTFRHVATLADEATARGVVNVDGWNQYHIIARGSLVLHILNGRLLSVLIDEDPARIPEGLLGLQMHVGGPFKVEFRNIYYRKL